MSTLPKATLMSTPPTTTPAPTGVRSSSSKHTHPPAVPSDPFRGSGPPEPRPRPLAWSFPDLPPGVEATRLPPLVPLSDNLSDIRRVQENAGHLPDPHPDNILMYLCEAQQLLRAAEQSSALLSVAVPAVRATVAALGASAEAATERFGSAETAIARWGKAIRDLGESQQLAATRLGRCQALEAQVSDLRAQLAGLRSAPPTAAPTPQPLPSAPNPLNRQEGANIIRGVLQRLTPEDAITTAEAMLAWAVTLH